MNRLAVRLVLAVIGVAVLSLVLVVLLQSYLLHRVLNALPPELRRLLTDWGTDGDAAVGASREQIAIILESLVNVQFSATLLSVVLSAVLWLLLAVSIVRAVAKPVGAVSKAAARVAEGDLSARVPPPKASAKGEVAELSRHFNLMAASLEAYERERRAMIADIAHELRTPITAMQGRLEALLDGLTPLTREEALRLHRQASLLGRLVGDLRTLSLADEGRLSLERRVVDAAELARSVGAHYQREARERRMSLELPAPDHAVCVPLDPDRIAQVLTNLLDNAFKYTPDGGRVRVSVRAEGGTVRLEVRDSGEGFPEGDEARIFDRFYRADASRRLAKSGSGLGLAIARALVEGHGGRISAARGAEGTTFCVALPQTSSTPTEI